MNDLSETSTSRLLASLETLIDAAGRLSASIDRSSTARPTAGVVPRTAAPNVNPRQLVAGLYSRLLAAHKAVEDVTKQHQLLQELVNTSALLTSSLELDVVLEEVIDTIVALTGAERAYLMLRDDKTGELDTRAARNWNRETIPEPEITLSRGVIDIALKGDKPVLTTNALSDRRFQDLSSIATHQMRSIVCIPLTLRDNNIGVLYADNRMRSGQFSQDIATILTAFAHQTVIAIENARLYTQVREDLSEAQQVIERLRIQIDEQASDSQIRSIENSDFFRRLREAITPSNDAETTGQGHD